MTSFLSDLKSVTRFRDTTAADSRQQQQRTRFGDGFSPSKKRVISHTRSCKLPMVITGSLQIHEEKQCTNRRKWTQTNERVRNSGDKYRKPPKVK